MAIVDTKTADDFYALLGRLYGTTYGSQDTASVFQRQLRSWATLLALGRSEIDRAFRQAFPDLSDALIAEWEQAYSLPNDSARSLAERQARCAAHERTQRGAARDDLQETLDTTGSFGMFSGNRRVEVEQSDSEDRSIFQVTLQLANEDYYNPLVREAMEVLFGNALPARNVGAMSELGTTAATVVEVGARWASVYHYLGRDAMGRLVGPSRVVHGQPARVKSYGPGSRINARDLNRIQETILGSALDGEFGLTDYSGAGRVGILSKWFGADLLDGIATTLDTSIDWRDRMVWASYQWSRDGGAARNIIVPGEAGDNTWGDASNGGIGIEDVDQNANTISVYTGTGSTASPTYRGFSSNSTPRIHLYCNTSGDLIAEAEGDDFNVCGLLWATPDLGKR